MKIIGKLAVVVAATVVFVTGSFAQEKQETNDSSRKENFEKIEAAKKQFFVSELKLEDAQVQKFWAIYTAYRQANKSIKKSIRTVTRETNHGIDSLSEKDLKANMEQIFNFESQEIQNTKDYLSKASAVIGYRKAVHSLELERRFKKQLMARTTEKGGENQKHIEKYHGFPTEKTHQQKEK